MNLQNMTREEQIKIHEYAKQKSLTKPNSEIAIVDYHGKKKKYDVAFLKKIAIAGSAVVIAAAIGIGIGIGKAVDNKANDSNDEKIIESVFEEYENIVDNETHYVMNPNGGYVFDNSGSPCVWYDTYSIANQVLESENPTIALYQVYKDIEGGSSPEKNMNAVMAYVGRIIRSNPEKYEAKGIQEYDSFDSYLVGIGCVDKDGKASTKAYDEKITDYALKVGKLNNAQSQVDNMESGMKR